MSDSNNNPLPFNHLEASDEVVREFLKARNTRACAEGWSLLLLTGGCVVGLVYAVCVENTGLIDKLLPIATAILGFLGGQMSNSEKR